MSDSEKYLPMTPAGSPLMHLASSEYSAARDALLNEAAHMPYQGWAGFYERGYRIYEMRGDEYHELPENSQ